MKTQFNITTSCCDLDRYTSAEDFLSVLQGFDGVELMYCEDDRRGIIPSDRVIGLHMSSLYYWLDFWNGDDDRCLKEFGCKETMHNYYGGMSRQALIDRFCRDWEIAKRYNAEYVVFHVADSSSEETLTGRYSHTDEEVIDATCDLVNQALSGEADGPVLLLENLWEPGLSFTRPEITDRLMTGIRYPRKGIMLDTGHLMHTDLSLRTQTEALAYIHRCLDAHGELCKHIRGVHLNQSLTGAYMKRIRKNPPVLSADYSERMNQLFTYVFQADLHKPFVCAGVQKLIERISPEYLTFEFVSNSREKHERMLLRQRRALK